MYYNVLATYQLVILLRYISQIFIYHNPKIYVGYLRIWSIIADAEMKEINVQKCSKVANNTENRGKSHISDKSDV